MVPHTPGHVSGHEGSLRWAAGIGLASILFVSQFADSRAAGLTDSQQRILSAIQEHCPALHNLNQQGLLSGNNATWADSCWSLINTYYAITKPGNVTVDRGAVIGGITTLDQFGRALNESSQFKPLSLGQGAIESANGQFALLAARLQAVRMGATGFSLASLNPATSRIVGANGMPVTGGAAGDAGGLLDNRLSFFLNGDFNFGDREQTARMASFDFGTQGVTGGADYRFTDNLVAGLAGRYVGSNLNVTGSGGGANTDTFGFSTYGTYYLKDFHLDAIFSYQWTDYSMNRGTVYGAGANSVNTRSTNTTSGTQYAFAGGGGYDFHVGGFTFGPDARAQYLHAQTNAYDEAGSASADDMHINQQTLSSLITTLSGRANYAINTSFGVLTPELRMSWNHEFENNARSVVGYYRYDIFKTTFGILTDKPDRDYGTLGASIAGQFAHGVSGFINYGTVFGLSYSQVHTVTAGFRMEY